MQSVALSRNQSQSVSILRNPSQSGTLQTGSSTCMQSVANQSQSVAVSHNQARSNRTAAPCVRSSKSGRAPACNQSQSVAIIRNQHAISRNHRAVARPKAEEQRPIGGDGRRVERLESERFPLQSDGSHLMREAISMQSLYPTNGGLAPDEGGNQHAITLSDQWRSHTCSQKVLMPDEGGNQHAISLSDQWRSRTCSQKVLMPARSTSLGKAPKATAPGRALSSRARA